MNCVIFIDNNLQALWEVAYSIKRLDVLKAHEEIKNI